MNGEVSTSNAKLVYILYLVGILIGVTGIVGVIMAYINRGDARTGWTPITSFRSGHSGLVYFI